LCLINTDQQMNIKFLVKLKRTATKTFNLLYEANVEDPYQQLMCFEWHKRFSEGREH